MAISDHSPFHDYVANATKAFEWVEANSDNVEATIEVGKGWAALALAQAIANIPGGPDL